MVDASYRLRDSTPGSVKVHQQVKPANGLLEFAIATSGSLAVNSFARVFRLESNLPHRAASSVGARSTVREIT